MKEGKEQLHIEIMAQTEIGDIDLKRIDRLVRAICEHFKAEPVSVNIQIVDDAAILEINEQFLSHDYTTDVISFDMTDEEQGGQVFDLVVNVEMARRQSEQRGHSAQAELALYVTHGLLHHFGYDDLEPELATVMHKKEDELLRANGFGAVYHD